MALDEDDLRGEVRVWCSSYIGRSDELDLLEKRFDEAVDGSGSMIFIKGEAGIGKTRLVLEFRKRIAERNATFLIGRTLDDDGVDPYLPFMDALRDYMDREDMDSLGVDDDTEVLPLGLIPTLGDSQPMLGGSMDMDNAMEMESERFDVAKEREKMFETYRDLILSIAEERPLVLVIDDAHWADPSSLKLLQFITRDVARSRILILTTYRPEDLETRVDHPLGEALARMSRERLFHTLEIPRLDEEDTRKMLETILAIEYVPEDFLSTIYDRSEGNPFYIEEAVATLIEDEVVVVGSPECIDQLNEAVVSMPETVRDLFQHRIKQLDSQALRILRHAAVVGKQFSFDLLFRSLTGHDEEQVAETLEDLVRKRVIRLQDETTEVFRFDNIAFQEVVYEGIGPVGRRVIHRKVGASLEQTRDGREKVYALARHFGIARVPEKAYDYAMLAADRSYRLFAIEESVQYLERALEYMTSIMDPTAEQSKNKLQALMRLGEIRFRLGDWEEAYQNFDEAIRESTSSGYVEIQAEAIKRRGHLHQERHDFDTAMIDYEKALELFTNLQNQQGEYEVRRGMGKVYWRKGMIEEAKATLFKAIEQAEDVGDSVTRGIYLIDLGNVYSDSGMHKEAEEHYKMGLHILEGTSEYYDISRAMNNLGDLIMRQERYEEAIRFFEDSVEMARKAKELLMEALAFLNIGECNAKLERYNLALEATDKAAQMFKRMESKLMLGSVYMVYGLIYKGSGEWDKARENFDTGLEYVRKADAPFNVGYTLYEYALMEMKAGANETAKRYLDEAEEYLNKVGAKEFLMKVHMARERL